MTIKTKLVFFSFIFILFAFTVYAAKKVYYDPTIKNIVTADCSRCHSGAVRNLMDYDSLRAYADSGLLSSMVQGPMFRFAGSNDAETILNWVKNGVPEKPSTTQANFNNRITYNNTIKYILVKDCLRCHSGQFRNLTTYKNLKIYVDNGLLKTLVQRGGPMHRFAGPDSHAIIAWINNGAPE
ncbi:MAG: hypothetical protein HQK79_11240 [Desulfobacterales bacterium]|nr:hypothetical protein [Desulfobacterales bacterium]